MVQLAAVWAEASPFALKPKLKPLESYEAEVEAKTPKNMAS